MSSGILSLPQNLVRQLKIIAKKILGKDFESIKEKINLSLCPDLSLGDFSSNILFLLAKVKKDKPINFFPEFKAKLEKLNYIKKVEFVNG